MSIAFYRVEDIRLMAFPYLRVSATPSGRSSTSLVLISDQKSSGNLFGTTDYFSPYLDTTAAHNPKITYG